VVNLMPCITAQLGDSVGRQPALFRAGCDRLTNPIFTTHCSLFRCHDDPFSVSRMVAVFVDSDFRGD
jgi:hypothetical protein